MAVIYPGNIPANVGKDAKYSVVSGADGYEVRLVYRVSKREKQLLTTAAHPNLVEMVNAVKKEHNGTPGGAFYINEFLDVLVPTADSGCYFAGTYRETLAFDMEGTKVSALSPEGLEPGDEWPGPRVGIRYKLKAGGRDISYTRKDGSRETEHCLSDVHDSTQAAALAKRIARVKGDSGGRIYLNEAAEFFGPPSDPGDPFVYLGPLGDDLWFPPPSVPRP
ncbi:hypothetical protein IMCC26207_110175 [Actinobacteria bacterium IMCC26207]|nr:hypothetical protein IMCC26207_110175 [Actinobacteria bacterium IMCC26207]